MTPLNNNFKKCSIANYAKSENFVHSILLGKKLLDRQSPKISHFSAAARSFRFPSVRCFYLMESSYQSVCRWNSLNLLLLLLLLLLLWALFWFQRNLTNIIMIIYDFVVGCFSFNDKREHNVAKKVNLPANDVIATTFGAKSYYTRDLYYI